MMVSYQAGTTVDLLSLIPKCGSCLEDFDTFLHAPQILPCCHTFCLMCISKEKQRKKRRCMLCKEKYSRFLVNTAYIVLIARLHAQRRLEERVSARCEECDKRLPLMSMRRCATCEHEIRKIIDHPHQTCCVCLECCVDRHNGHKLHRIIMDTNSSSNTRFIEVPLRQSPQQIFIRRALCGNVAPSTPSTGLTSAASSSSESNPTSRHSTSIANKEHIESEETVHNGQVRYAGATRAFSRIQVIDLAKHLNGICNLRGNKAVDLGSSLESALSCIENSEYFRCGEIESGFCTPLGSSAPTENPVNEQTFTAATAPQSSDDARGCNNAYSTSHGFLPNMPRRNRFRGGPSTSLFTTGNETDSETIRLGNEMLPIVVRGAGIDRRNTHKRVQNTVDLISENKQVRSSSLRSSRSTTGARRFAVRSDYTLQSETQTEEHAHDYENIVKGEDQVSVDPNNAL